MLLKNREKITHADCNEANELQILTFSQCDYYPKMRPLCPSILLCLDTVATFSFQWKDLQWSWGTKVIPVSSKVSTFDNHFLCLILNYDHLVLYKSLSRLTITGSDFLTKNLGSTSLDIFTLHLGVPFWLVLICF